MFSQSPLLGVSVVPINDMPLSFSTRSSLKQKIKITTRRYQNNVVYDQTRSGTYNKKIHFGIRHVCNAIPHEQLVITQPKQDDDAVIVADGIHEDLISSIKSIFNSMEDGELTISPYDTAWLALIKDDDDNAPLFPSCLEWIANNQLEDGSWGDSDFYLAHDRVINTLACVVALKSWNVHPGKIERGILSIKQNMYKLHEDSEEHMLIAFEVAFPSLLEMAEKLDIEVIEDPTLLRTTYEKRDLKLKKIPNDILHTVHTPLLHTLEGVKVGLDWEKLLKLQFEDGSFYSSPSSTAFAFMHTKDQNCLRFLKRVVDRFQNGGVPYCYPVDLFERMWAIDRLQRLGVSRYFQPEIKTHLAYLHSYWTENGIGATRGSRVEDVDDTSMGFRLLRSHGFPVSTSVYKQFEKGDEFICMLGQSTQAVTGTYNLLRTSQLMFPGESTFLKARRFAIKFLKEKRASNQLLDKWIISKDLPGEVCYTLDVPFYANLPRVEARFYVEHYSGDDDVWIGKTLYRMLYVSNNKYLNLAKLDFKICQDQHQLEWETIQTWYANSSFGGLGISREELLLSYFLAAACIFEPERSDERMAWAKTSVLIKLIKSYFNNENTSSVDKMALINKLKDGHSRHESETNELLVSTLMETINQLGKGRNIHQRLYSAWEKYVTTGLYEEGNGHLGEAELLIQTIYPYNDEPFTSDYGRHLLQATNNVCNMLRQYQDQKYSHVNGINNGKEEMMMLTPEIENGMQELVQLVYQNSPESEKDAYLKQTCLIIAKSFYYTAYCDTKTIDSHISKVLFEKVI